MPSTVHLKVMSFNIQHGKGLDGKVNLDRTAEVIRRSDADVIGLQEVDRFLFRSGFHDQASRLAEALDMQWCFSPSIKLGFMEYGNMILSRFPIVARKVVLMRGLGERRSLLMAGLNVAGQRVNIVNTHLGVLPQQRRKQVPILHDTLSPIQAPTILMGDFNMDWEHKLLGPIAHKCYKMRPHIRIATNRRGGEIDHIFTTMPVTQSITQVEPTTASDHHPVVSEIWFTLETWETQISQAVN